MPEDAQQKAVFKDEATQHMLNDPVSQTSFRNPANQQFLEEIIKLIDSGKIELYVPHSLINDAIYQALSEEIRGKVDLEAMNLLAAIRDIKGLHDSGNNFSYQMENMIDRVRNTKERIETESGDVFVI